MNVFNMDGNVGGDGEGSGVVWRCGGDGEESGVVVWEGVGGDGEGEWCGGVWVVGRRW